MHKFPLPVAHDIGPTRRRHLLRSGAILVLGLSLAPLVAECSSLCYSQWCQVMGWNVQARTPVLDSVHDGLESGHRSVWDGVSSYFQRLPWNPAVVLAVGVVLMMLAMCMLRL